MTTLTKNGNGQHTESAMRRYSLLLLFGLGTFLLVAAVLMRFYAYPKLAVAPLEQKSDTFLSAEDATILDLATLSPITTDLEVSVRTQGDVAASEEAGDDVRIWVSTTSIRSADGEIRSRSVDRAPFDTVTGFGVDCCDGWTSENDGERVPTTFEGVVFKFPFNTQKEDYPYWDGTLREPVTLSYDGEEEVDGLTTYRFIGEVPDTVVGTRDVPGSLVNSDEATVTADTHYANAYTILVEPNTGAIVDLTQEQNGYVEANGAQIPTTQATISYTDAQVADMVDEVGTQGPLLGNLRGLFPIGAAIIGLLLLGAGFALMRSRRA